MSGARWKHVTAACFMQDDIVAFLHECGWALSTTNPVSCTLDLHQSKPHVMRLLSICQCQTLLVGLRLASCKRAQTCRLVPDGASFDLSSSQNLDQTFGSCTGGRGFCEVVLSDDGEFLRRYHTQRGDEEISITSWHAQPGIGEVREVKFLTHTKVTANPTGLDFERSASSFRSLNDA